MNICTTIKKIIKYFYKDSPTRTTMMSYQKQTQRHPYTWLFLKQFSLTNPPKITLYRDVETDKNYDKLRKQLKENRISTTDYLKAKLFGGQHKFKEYRFIKNDFGYNITSNIQHYNLWLNPTVDLELDNKKIKQFLDKIIVNGKYVVFKNLPQNMSVPGIIHYHIFF